VTLVSRLACAVLVLTLWPSAVQTQAAAAPNRDLALVEAVDRNPDSKIVEVDLTARIAEVEIGGTRVKAWTYNGSVPGPLIRAHLGDRLIVHFSNELPDPTTVHWHGVRVPIAMDGVPGISQPEVRHGESFTYDFVVRDAGLFWYHPHVMSAAQVGFGLSGALLVDDPGETAAIGVSDELTLVLNDMGFDDKGTLAPADSGGSAGMVFGREGNHVLVNGRLHPTLHARAGVPQRWRIVNTAKSRFFTLYLDDVPFTIIGGDGGLNERAETRHQVLITPGERVDLIVTPTGAPGSELLLQSLLHNRGYGSIEFRAPEEMMTIALSSEPAAAARALPAMSRTIVPPIREGAVTRDLVITLPPVDTKGHSEFRINGVPYWEAAPLRAEPGATEIWTVKNDTDWDHPFHLHGFFFVVLDARGEPVRPLAWKDTVNIPMRTTTRLLVTLDEPGTWMFHCHILDHADGGLMGTVQVGPGSPAHLHDERPESNIR